MKKHNLKSTIAVGAAIMAMVCTTVNPIYHGVYVQNEPAALAQIEIQDTSDAVYISDADCVIYELSDSRTYGNPGNNNDSVDFEAYFGISLSVENNTVTAATYIHNSSYVPKSISFGRLSAREMVSPKLYSTVKPISIDMSKLSNGVYEFKSEFDTDNGTRYVSGYVYKNGSSIQTCRTVMSQDVESIRYDMNKWNTVMADADPDDYLSNAMITYPTSGDGKYCNHTSAWEQISDEIIGDNTHWSDELKVFAFVQYLVNNVAYDNYKVNMSNKYGTTSRARLAGDYTDDSLFTLGNNVGVCWDYVNILAIMCRHHGIPATSADYRTHTVSAVWLNNGWKAIDITVLAKYTCTTEDTSRETWIDRYREKYSTRYGYYDSQIQVHDDNIWTQSKGRG